jgi:uncharacterized protein
MHPVRVHTVNLSEKTKLLDSKYLRPLLRLEHTPHGLHYANDVPDHPHLLHVESHVLPTLDLMVSFFTEREGGPYPPRFYCDMASIEAGPEIWTVRDLYLDVSVCPGHSPELLDMAEYAEAVLEGHLTPDEQRRALLSAERVVNGLFAHNNDLEVWLASLNIHLNWWTPVNS